MTDGIIPKYLLFANEKNESMDVRHLVYTGDGLSLGMSGDLRGNLITVYTVSYICL